MKRNKKRKFEKNQKSNLNQLPGKGPVRRSSNKIIMTGKVVETLPGAVFKVKLETLHEVLGHLSGRMRMNFIKIVPGDSVEIEFSPYNLERGRIIKRL